MKFIALHGDRTISPGSLIDYQGNLVELLYNPYCPGDTVCVIRFDDAGKYIGQSDQFRIGPGKHTLVDSVWMTGPRMVN